MENSKNAPVRKDKILTSVPRSAFFDGESRSRFGLELTEELEAAMSSSNALMSTVAALRAGVLFVYKYPPRALGSERGSKVSSAEGVKTLARSGSIRRHSSSKKKVQI